MMSTKSKQETIDLLMKSLGAFTALAVAWVVLDLVAGAVNPFGAISLLAALAFLSAMVSLFGVLAVASTLLRH
jgi:hypothetical protein